MKFFAAEAWHAFTTGMRSGIVTLIYLVLTAYLLLVLGNADHVNEMVGLDVPRNAPGLIYLMTSGDTFFLFFAWAWVFAQVVLRDRTAHLDEITLSMPLRLDVLLAARYVGALGVAWVVGSSQMAGFLAAPVLEWLGAVPQGSVTAPPWTAFAWANLLFTLPLAAGLGALYTLAALRTRSLGGPLAVAAALMTFWMVAMVVFKSGHMDPFWATLLDPSGYAEAEHQVLDQWTPQEKASAFLAFTPALLCNRVLWCIFPVLILAWYVRRVRRQDVLLGPERRRTSSTPAPQVTRVARPLTPGPSPARGEGSEKVPRPLRERAWGEGGKAQPPIETLHPWHAARMEAAWQVRQLLGQRWLHIALPFLVLMAMAGAFVHGVQHADGPMVPRPEWVTPLLGDMFRMIFIFMLAGMVGMAARRDEQPGLQEMWDAAPMPMWVRVVGRCAAAWACAALLALIPALGALGVGWLLAPAGSVRLWEVFAYQGLVLLPALLEISALVLLVHALIRRAALAWAASMLAVFMLVVNYEVGLVAYPPYQMGQGIDIALSGITGLRPWLERLLLGDSFKLLGMALLLTAAVLVQPIGCDVEWRSRWRVLRQRLWGGAGGALLLCLVALWAVDQLLHEQWVEQGGFQSYADSLAEDAAWEKRWLAQADTVETRGGHLKLELHPQEQQLQATWQLHAIRSASGWLHAALPHGLHGLTAQVENQARAIEQEADHMALPLGACAARDSGCAVTLHWQISARGWHRDEADAVRPSWLGRHGWWLRPHDVMPRLGFDSDRVLRVPQERQRLGLPKEPLLPPYASRLPSGAAAPAGDWQWSIHDGMGTSIQGRTTGLLDFAYAYAPALHTSRVDGLAIQHDASRATMAAAIAEDVQAMHACVARRLGSAASVQQVVQWPRGLGDTVLAGGHLALAEKPHWDVTEQGTGRWARRAEIASALARRTIRDRAHLHSGGAAVWLEHGLPGALGLACVAETDGTAALHALLQRGARQTHEALAGSTTPITRLDAAPSKGWAQDYLPLAALPWVVSQTPDTLLTLLDNTQQQRSVTAALAETLGPELTKDWLGAPIAVDVQVQLKGITGQRWQWDKGGWQPLPEAPLAVQAWRHSEGGLTITPAETAPQPDALYLDGQWGFERQPQDNRVQ